jgi:predicted O-methyltransferase YrrM
MLTSYAIRKTSAYYPHLHPDNIAKRLWYSTFVNYERRYLYFEVPKAACTWMKTLIHSLERLPPIPPYTGSSRQVRRDMFVHSRRDFALPSLLHFEDAVQREILESPTFFRFTIVRNPYTRLASAWRDKVQACAPGYSAYYLRLKGGLPRSNVPDSFIRFDEFVREIAKEDLTRCDPHWRLQVEHNLSLVMNFSLVGRMESLRDAVATFLDRAGFRADALPDAVNQSAGVTDYDENLAERVFKLYERDFANLDYGRGSWQSIRKSSEHPRDEARDIKAVAEIAERNIVIDQLYGELDALRKELAKSTIGDTSARLSAYRAATFDDLFRDCISRIDGSATKEEACYLFELAKSAPSGCIVELGSFRGRATMTLALGTTAGNSLPVYAVEPHEPFVGELGDRSGPLDRAHFMKELVALGLYSLVRLVNVPGEALAAKSIAPISMLLLDADPRYHAIKRDVEHWREALATGASLLFAGSSNPDSGPGRVARELIQSAEFALESVVGGITHLRKVT